MREEDTSFFEGGGKSLPPNFFIFVLKAQLTPSGNFIYVSLVKKTREVSR